MFWLILVFIIIPTIEIAIFIWTGQKLGAWMILLMIFLSGISGVLLVRHQGMETWKSMQLSLYNREVPKEQILDGICIIIGGVLLIAPGFLTDLLGFLLVIPWTRKPFKTLLSLLIMKKITQGKIYFWRW